MKKIVFIVIQLFFFFLVSAQTLKTRDTLILREGIGSSREIAEIPKGTKLTIDSNILLATYTESHALVDVEKWAVITYEGNRGYVLLGTYTAEKNDGSIRLNDSLDIPKVQAIPPYFNVSPKGSTALCKDGTYSSSPYPNYTCSHHGGVIKWLDVKF